MDPIRQLAPSARVGERVMSDVMLEGLMKYLFLSLALTCLVVVGCKREKTLSLSRNTQGNHAAVQKYIPVGTPTERAVSLMKTAGFSCEIKKNETLTLTKGTRPIGTIAELDFVLCTKNDGETQWDVALLLDQEDKVRDVAVSSKPSP